MKMDLKTLMGYVLKYNLNVKLLTTTDNNAIYRAVGVNVHTNEIYLYCDTTSCGFAESLSNITIVLRPLSDLVKLDCSLYGLTKTEILNTHFEYLPYGLIDTLLQNHIDIFRLIDNGLAIDINTLSE